HPDSVMVNTTTKLVGTGWPANKTIRLQECSRTQWVVTQNPCDTSNAVKVTSDAQGRFVTRFTALLCPATTATPAGDPAETCYIGHSKPNGVDTVKLVGAVKITVTYP